MDKWRRATKIRETAFITEANHHFLGHFLESMSHSDGLPTTAIHSLTLTRAVEGSSAVINQSRPDGGGGGGGE